MTRYPREPTSHRVRFISAHSSSRVSPGFLSPLALGPRCKHVTRKTQGRETEHGKKDLGSEVSIPWVHLLQVSPPAARAGDRSFTLMSLLKSLVVGFSIDAISQIKAKGFDLSKAIPGERKQERNFSRSLGAGS